MQEEEKQQEKQFEGLLLIIKKQKNIAQELHKEVNEQNKILDDLNKDVKITKKTINLSNKKLHKILGNKKSWIEWFKSWFK